MADEQMDCDLCGGDDPPVLACPVCGRPYCDGCADGGVCADCAETIDEELDDDG